MSWKKWAEKALTKMNEKNPRPITTEWRAAEEAIRNIKTSGLEPYYTLKAFVCLNDLE